MVREVSNKLKNLSKEADDEGCFPLHYAATQGCVEIVKSLLKDDKYTAYIKDIQGRTALHLAAQHGNYKTMKEIITCCPDCCELVDNRGWNALHFAIEGDQDDAVDVIMNNDSLTNLINEKDIHGNTPFLHVASSSHYFWSLFENSKVDKKAFNKKNQNAFDIVSRSKRVAVLKTRIKQILHDNGFRPGLRIPVHTKDAEKEGDGDDDDDEESGLMSVVENAVPSTLVAATLIATVTFAAGFTLPGDYVSDKGALQGTAILGHNKAFQAFMITDTIAFVLSTAAVCTNLFLIFLRRNVMRMVWYHWLSFILTGLAMGAMLIAFVTGTYAVLAHSLPLAIATCVIGLSFFLFFYFLWKRIVFS